MTDITWLDMMEKMQDIRLFCSCLVRRAKKDGITSAQEMDMLSRIVLSEKELTPQDLSIQMGLQKSTISRLIDHLEKKEFLGKHYSETDKRSYTLFLTEQGNTELSQTYRYYLEPIYNLREILGKDDFEALTTKIHNANRLILEKQGR